MAEGYVEEISRILRRWDQLGLAAYVEKVRFARRIGGGA